MTEINQDRRNLFIGSSNLRTSRMLTKAHSGLVSAYSQPFILYILALPQPCLSLVSKLSEVTVYYSDH